MEEEFEKVLIKIKTGQKSTTFEIEKTALTNFLEDFKDISITSTKSDGSSNEFNFNKLKINDESNFYLLLCLLKCIDQNTILESYIENDIEDDLMMFNYFMGKNITKGNE